MMAPNYLLPLTYKLFLYERKTPTNSYSWQPPVMGGYGYVDKIDIAWPCMACMGLIDRSPHDASILNITNFVVP